VPEPFLSASRDPDSPHWLGKVLLDVGAVLGEQAVARSAAPLRHVFLMVPGGGGRDAVTIVELASRIAEARELDGLFETTDGVEILARRDDEHLCAWRLRLQHDRGPTEHLSEVLESERVVLFEKRWEERPDFTADPEATPVLRRKAAGMLAREMLNRRVRGRLLAGYGGSAARLFVDIAAALSSADCWSIRVGDRRKTADLIEKLTDQAVPTRTGQRTRPCNRPRSRGPGEV
jgi:hypothetical protein